MTPEDPNADEQLAHRGGELVRAAALGVSAPLGLRERIERDRTGVAAPPPARRRLWLGGAFAASMAVVALVVVLATGGSPAGPTVAQASQLGLRAATGPAPARDPSSGTHVLASEGGVRFPYWADNTPWEPTGRRTDTLAGRHTTTVFYDAGSVRLGYTIVGGHALTVPDGQEIADSGHSYVVLHRGARTIVTWQEGGHTCIITSPSSVSTLHLVSLASDDNA